MSATVLAIASGAHAQQGPSRTVLGAITLDLDGDGRPDHAELLQGAETAFADLSITLAPRGGAGQPLRAAIRKNSLVEGHVFSLSSNARGSLSVQAGCGGCSNDYETALTIAFRRGRPLVVGVTRDWDTREGRGHCDINLLTGRGAVSRGDARATPRHFPVAPVALATWSPDRFAALCGSP